MGIFKRLIKEWLRDGELTLAKSQPTAELISSDRLTFHVSPAHGGRVVEIQRPYKEDQRGHVIRYDNRPYLITDEQDFTVELAKIVTMELLKEG